MQRVPVPHQVAWHIAGAYALVASAWILFSDRVVEALGDQTFLQTYKGLGFVAVTALLLYVLVLRSSRVSARSRLQLEAVVRTSPAGICLMDHRGKVAIWNPAAERMLGWAADEMIGRAMPPELDTSFNPDSRDVVAAGKDIPFNEVVIRTKDGRVIDVAYQSGVIAEVGSGTAGTVLLFVDITRRKTAERELALNREHLEEMVADRTAELEAANRELERLTQAKSDFLASMSHELRTPLNSIIGFSGIMLDGLVGELSAEQTVQLGMVREAGEHLHVLINDILDLSKIEAGQVTLSIDDVDVAALVDEVVGLLAWQAKERGIPITVVPMGGVKARLDPTRTRQVLFNLIDNAVRYTRIGTVCVERISDEGRVGIAVTDTGAGLAPDQVDLVFEQFYRVVQEGPYSAEGSGLGLPISRRLARLMGGDVTLESEVGRGSTFTFWLPTTTVSGSNSVAQKKAEEVDDV